VPEISRFFGIVIAIYYNDHVPAHFHARYGSLRGRFSIESLEMIDGDLGRKALALVREWASLHRTNFGKTGNLRNSESLF